MSKMSFLVSNRAETTREIQRKGEREKERERERETSPPFCVRKKDVHN